MREIIKFCEPEGGPSFPFDELKRPSWEGHWHLWSESFPSSEFIGKVPDGYRAIEALKQVFIQMTIFLKEGTNEHLRRKHLSAVREELTTYLSLRGHEVHSRPPLSDKELQVLKIIKAQSRAITGPGIIKAIARSTNFIVEQSTLTRHIIPKLKKWYGVKNRPGVGYYWEAT
jgi:hypothetical protein